MPVVKPTNELERRVNILFDMIEMRESLWEALEDKSL